jgi:addiction module HigA family antidote
MHIHSPVHPGVIIREYMGNTMDLSRLSKQLDMPKSNLSMILNGRLGVTSAMAVKLSNVFPTSRPDTWLALQAQHDTAKARRSMPSEVSSKHVS